MLQCLRLVHVVGFALFLGSTAAAVLVFSLGNPSETRRLFALELAVGIQKHLMTPGALATLLSGGLLSTLGPWGWLRYRWMFGKLAGTVVLAIHSQLSFRPLTARLLTLASEGAADSAEYADGAAFFMRVGLIQVAVLVLLAFLGIFKPGGLRRAPSKSPRTTDAP